jgi:hypothetical protein
MTTVKAYLEFCEPSSSGERGPATVNGRRRLEFQFNPKEMSVQKSADWKRDSTPSAENTSAAQFTGSGARSLSLELFLDATIATDRNVVGEAETLLACLVPLPKTMHAQKPSPPYVRFGWGQVHLLAFVKSVGVKYSLFRPDGTPIRAACAVTLEEVTVNAEKQNPTSGALRPLRSHTLVAGDSLMSLAYAEYGDPTQWRRLADANGIDDPTATRAGQRLFVPTAGSEAAGRA